MTTAEYRIVFNGDIHERSANALRHNIANALQRPDLGSLVVVFSSDGGSTDHAIALYNFLRSLPVPVHIHAAGHVGSAAVTVFLAGRKRTCAPQSRFFFHAYHWTFQGPQSSDRIAEATKRLDSDSALAQEITRSNTSIPEDRLQTLFGRAPTPTIFGVQEAKELGIVQDVLELNPLGDRQENVVVWTVGWQ